LLIVDADAPFALDLTTELEAAGVATLHASDTHAAKRLLSHRTPPPVVIDLRYARLPLSPTVVVKP
jgi:ActR/RegA family two-component response regulator